MLAYCCRYFLASDWLGSLISQTELSSLLKFVNYDHSRIPKIRIHTVNLRVGLFFEETLKGLSEHLSRSEEIKPTEKCLLLRKLDKVMHFFGGSASQPCCLNDLIHIDKGISYVDTHGHAEAVAVPLRVELKLGQITFADTHAQNNVWRFGHDVI